MTPDAPYSATRKIDPSKRPATRPDGSPDDNDRVEIGPTPLAFEEWEAAGIVAPDLAVMRQYRLDRICAMLAERDTAAVLLFDPLNIRYASDTTNMQLWNAHNPFRACLVTADGYMIVWDFKPGTLLTGFNPLIRETRGDASFFYFVSGDRIEKAARDFAAEIDAVVRLRCGKSRRLAVDKIQIHGLRALEEVGFNIRDGEELMEKAPVRERAGGDRRHALRHPCLRAVAARNAAAGGTRHDRGGDLGRPACREHQARRRMDRDPDHGVRPAHQTPGSRNAARASSRMATCWPSTPTWSAVTASAPTSPAPGISATRPRPRSRSACSPRPMPRSSTTWPLLAPGTPMRELTFGGRPLPEEFVAERYACRMHGVGLCDEWPKIAYPEDWLDGAYEYALEPGMVLTVETYIGAVGGREGVKLEDQVLITETATNC